MNQHQHKLLSAIIITTITFLGFESLSVIIGLNQVHAFVVTAVYLFLFHIFWITFVFDLHLKHTASVNITSTKYTALVGQAILVRFRHFLQWRFLRHFLNYFVLPTILFWATVTLLFLNPFFSGLKEVLILSSTIALAMAYWHMKEHANRTTGVKFAFIQLVATTKLYGAYIAFAAVLGFSFYFGLPSYIVFYYAFGASFFLILQALFAYGYHKPSLVLVNLLCSLLIGYVAVWVAHNWLFEYFTGAVILIALYNTIWGFIHHTLEKTFTSKLALEYLILGLLVVSIIISTHNFGSRLI